MRTAEGGAMDKNEVVSKINKYIHMSTKVLSDWLADKLPKLSNGWGMECVLDKLSYNQRMIAEENKKRREDK